MTRKVVALRILFVTIMMLSARQSFAVLALYEPFDYPENFFLASTPIGTSNGTTNPQGYLAPNFNNWYGAGMGTGTYQTANDGLLTNTDLTVPGLYKPNATKSLSLGDQGYSMRLSLNTSTPAANNQTSTNAMDNADPLAGTDGTLQASDTGGTGYYSLAIRVTDITGLNSQGGVLLGFNNLIDAQTGNPNTIGAGLTIRPKSGGNANEFELGVVDEGATAFSSATWDTANSYTTNTTLFVVGKYQTVGAPFSGGTPAMNDDIAMLWINPSQSTFGGFEPAGAIANNSTQNDIPTNSSSNNHTLQSFVLRQNGTATNKQVPAGVIYDELRVGTTYADVTPISGNVASIDSFHFGYDSTYKSLTDAIRLSTRIGTAYWAQNQQNLNPENGAPIPYAYHDGYVEDLGTVHIPTAAAMALRWHQIMTGQGDSRTGVSGASIGFPNLIILDELNSTFQDSNLGPIFREAVRLYSLPTAQGGQGGNRNDLVTYISPSVSQGTGVTSGLYDDVIYAINNYMRGVTLEVYATEDGWRTGIESSTNPTQYPTGDAYLGVRLTGPMRNWINSGLSPSRLQPILNVSNIADTDVGGDFNAFLNREFWFMANGRYDSTPTHIDPNIRTSLRGGVGTYTWKPDADNTNDPYQLLTSHVLRDNFFETLFNWYVVDGQMALYTTPPGDYNLDGKVDSADLLAWRASYGMTTGDVAVAADGNHNGVVDVADYIIWRKAYSDANGRGSVVQYTVPEPTTISLLILGFFSLFSRRRAAVS